MSTSQLQELASHLELMAAIGAAAEGPFTDQNRCHVAPMIDDPVGSIDAVILPKIKRAVIGASMVVPVFFMVSRQGMFLPVAIRQMPEDHRDRDCLANALSCAAKAACVDVIYMASEVWVAQPTPAQRIADPDRAPSSYENHQEAVAISCETLTHRTLRLYDIVRTSTGQISDFTLNAGLAGDGFESRGRYVELLSSPEETVSAAG